MDVKKLSKICTICFWGLDWPSAFPGQCGDYFGSAGFIRTHLMLILGHSHGFIGKHSDFTLLDLSFSSGV